MESGGMIRCTQCGYKNSPVYHYCGVCGAVLQTAKEEAPVKAAAPAPVVPAQRVEAVAAAPAAQARVERSDPPSGGGMSFLGLSDAPSSNGSSYLLDEQDEEERSVAWGRIFVVLILLGAAGGLGVQWYRGAYPFAARPAASVASTPATSRDTSSSASNTAAVPTPAPAPAAETPAPDAGKTAGEPAASTPPAAADATPADASKTEVPAETKPAAPAAAEIIPVEPEKKTAAPVEKAANVAPARVKPPAPARVQAPEPVEAPGESLFVQGQRYLYGNGVPANCDLALKSLLSAAARTNSKAQSTLGAMYSTGHCVTRDLPTAYKWFARALHQDPENSRLEQDLSVVWRQMTPGERTLATRQ